MSDTVTELPQDPVDGQFVRYEPEPGVIWELRWSSLSGSWEHKARPPISGADEGLSDNVIR